MASPDETGSRHREPARLIQSGLLEHRIDNEVSTDITTMSDVSLVVAIARYNESGARRGLPPSRRQRAPLAGRKLG